MEIVGKGGVNGRKGVGNGGRSKVSEFRMYFYGRINRIGYGI